MVNLVDFLHSDSCQAQTVRPTHCLRKLQLVFWPWLVLLPSFAIGTWLIRHKLVTALHSEWYSPTAEAVEGDINSDLGRAVSGTNQEELSIPQVLFRITATHYSRRETRRMRPEDTSHGSQLEMGTWPTRLENTSCGSPVGPGTWP